MEKDSNEQLEHSIQHDEITAKVMQEFTISGESTVFKKHLLNEDILPKNYSIGLIVGNSGSGKSTLLKEFGEEQTFEWDNTKSIISNFISYEVGSERLLSTGLCSIPSWLKPYRILSNGEKHKADLAVLLKDNLVIDEFVSYVDNNSANGLCNSVHKYIHKKRLRGLVFSTLNREIIDYLKPCWVYDTDTRELTINSKIYDITNLKEIEFEKKQHFMEF